MQTESIDYVMDLFHVYLTAAKKGSAVDIKLDTYPCKVIKNVLKFLLLKLSCS